MKIQIIKAGTKIVIGMSAGQAGTDSMEAYILTEDYTSEYLDEMAQYRGLDHASSYGIYPTEYMPNDHEMEENIGSDEYSDNIEGWWELYNEEKHAGECSYGKGVIFYKI